MFLNFPACTRSRDGLARGAATRPIACTRGVEYHPSVTAGPRFTRFALFLMLLPAAARAARELPEVKAGKDDLSKGLASSDLRQLQDKLPATGKVKDCCGYPVGEKQGFRLS